MISFDYRESVMTHLFILCALIVAQWPNVANASDDEMARVRTKLISESPAWVGQKVSFSVELMSSTFFSGTAHFDLPAVPGVIIMKADGSPVVSSETIDDETWSVQRHSFSAYPHREGRFEIPNFPVRFSVAPAFGKPPELQRLTTQAFSFEAKLPPGAEGLSLLISTSGLEVEESWNPSIPVDGTIELEVGDAISRTIILRAEDVPGMALPKIQLPDPSGVSTYPGQPEVSDKEVRGDLTGQRTESTTYVCTQPGEIQLPAVIIPWWDIDSQTLKRVTLKSIRVSVAQPENAGATDAPNDEETSQSESKPSLAWPLGLAAAALLCGLAWYFQDEIRQWFRLEHSKVKQSEAARFAKLELACTKNEPGPTLNALMRWLETRTPEANAVTIKAFVARHDNPQLAVELESLERAVIDPSNAWSGQILARILKKLRFERHGPKPRWNEFKLPPLNPTSGTSSSAVSHR